MNALAEKSESELAERLRIALPVLGDRDVQVKINCGAQQRLDLWSGALANESQHRASMSNDDSFLAVTFDDESDKHLCASVFANDVHERHGE